MTKDEYELEMATSYLDSPAFHLYMADVYEVIQGQMSIGDMRRALGDKYKAEWTADAIEALEGTGMVVKKWGVPSKYERNPRKPLTYGTGSRMGIKPAPSADMTKPHWQGLRKEI